PFFWQATCSGIFTHDPAGCDSTCYKSTVDFYLLTPKLAKGFQMLSKGLAVLAMVSFLAISTGCDDRYQEGFNAGYDQGYDEGYVDGDADGYERAREHFQSADYASGFADGQAAGIQTGYNQGYAVGKTD